jgi:ABC-type amino acid transport substrate-binding protein
MAKCRRILAFVLLVGLCLGISPARAEGNSAYDRVVNSGILRCGYIVWPPLFTKDPATGEYGGIFYDYVEAAGKALNLKIEWTEEVTPATYIEGLRAKRFDMLCSGDWPNSSRAKYLDYTDPIFYIPLMPFVKKEDRRFEQNLQAANNPQITVSTIDGEMSSVIARSDLPKAKTLELPNSSDPTLMLSNVASGKADMAITDMATGLKFMKNNDGLLRQVNLSEPVRLFPNTLSLSLGEDKLRQMINTATRELLYDGTIDRIITKHEEPQGVFYRIARPYNEHKSQ